MSFKTKSSENRELLASLKAVKSEVIRGIQKDTLIYPSSIDALTKIKKLGINSTEDLYPIIGDLYRNLSKIPQAMKGDSLDNKLLAAYFDWINKTYNFNAQLAEKTKGLTREESQKLEESLEKSLHDELKKIKAHRVIASVSTLITKLEKNELIAKTSLANLEFHQGSDVDKQKEFKAFVQTLKDFFITKAQEMNSLDTGDGESEREFFINCHALFNKLQLDHDVSVFSEANLNLFNKIDGLLIKFSLYLEREMAACFLNHCLRYNDPPIKIDSFLKSTKQGKPYKPLSKLIHYKPLKSPCPYIHLTSDVWIQDNSFKETIKSTLEAIKKFVDDDKWDSLGKNLFFSATKCPAGFELIRLHLQAINSLDKTELLEKAVTITNLLATKRADSNGIKAFFFRDKKTQKGYKELFELAEALIETLPNTQGITEKPEDILSDSSSIQRCFRS